METFTSDLQSNLTRIALVEAFFKARNCNAVDACSCDLCIDLVQLQGICGLQPKYDQSKHLEHLLPTLIGIREEAALDVLGIQHANNLFANEDIFSGIKEIREGALPAYRYYEENKGQLSGETSSLNRRTCFILVTIALPDAYLEYFRTRFN
jgi:hypothetical protein